MITEKKPIVNCWRVKTTKASRNLPLRLSLLLSLHLTCSTKYPATLTCKSHLTSPKVFDSPQSLLFLPDLFFPSTSHISSSHLAPSLSLPSQDILYPITMINQWKQLTATWQNVHRIPPASRRTSQKKHYILFIFCQSCTMPSDSCSRNFEHDRKALRFTW